MSIAFVLAKLRKAGQILLWLSIIGFFALACLDAYIQLEATFISKPFWRPPLLTGLVIAVAYLLIAYVINRILGILALHPQLLTALIPLVIRVAYNLWIRLRKKSKPDYVVIMGKN